MPLSPSTQDVGAKVRITSTAKSSVLAFMVVGGRWFHGGRYKAAVFWPHVGQRGLFQAQPLRHACQDDLIGVVFFGAQIGGDQRRRITRCLNLQSATFDGATLKKGLRITPHNFDMTPLLWGGATLNQHRCEFCIGINSGCDPNCAGLDTELHCNIALALQSPLDFELCLDLRIE